MRRYKDRKNTQKKAYYSDRFKIAPEIAKFAVEDGEFKQILGIIEKEIEIKKAYIELGQMVIYINSNDNYKALKVLKENGYDFLSELSAIDFLEKNGKFEIFYQILSMQKCKRIRIKCEIEAKERIKSVESIFKSANWAEREMYDMFGIIVINHPNLQRLIMPLDWHSYPLLKSYPLQGDEEAKWYEIDRIFGKEYREIVGEEQRDSAYVREKDTFNFSHIRHEVAYGHPPSDKPTIQDYQETDGVFAVEKMKKKNSKVIKKRP